MTGHAKRFTVALLVAALFSPAAIAQQSSGNIAGDGKQGDVVRVERASTGFVRELKVTEDGKYRVARVPIGDYVVTVTHADGTVDKPKTVMVRTGTTTRIK